MQPGLHDKELFVWKMTATNIKYRPLIVQVGHNARQRLVLSTVLNVIVKIREVEFL